LICAVPRAVRPQSNVTVDGSRQLFAVMCALHAAGYEAGVSALNFHPVRARLREVLLQKQGPAAEALREFYRNHRLADPAANLARYVSFAHVIGAPPDFKFTVTRDELPPEVLALDGFNEILANFDREANIAELWRSVQREYILEIGRLQPPVAQIVLVSSGYLREILKPQSRRTFTVIVEPMIGAKTSFRNVGDRYAVMLAPSDNPPLDEVRHSFLHFLLDPLPYRYQAVTNSRRIFLNYAARAPRLPVEYREDFEALLTECLVKAVELRLRRLPAEALAAELRATEQDGFVLVRALYRELEQSFEKAEPAMNLFFPDLLRGIKIGEEGQRLEKLQFAAAQPPPAAKTEEGAAAEPSELEQWLMQGERQIAAKDAAGATETFERVLSKHPGHPRARYGLAVASVLRGEAEQAKSIFQELIGGPVGDLSAEKSSPFVLAWSHVYLARIYDLEGNRELALSEYRAALAVEGAPDDARLAARRGLEKGFEPAKRPGASQRP